MSAPSYEDARAEWRDQMSGELDEFNRNLPEEDKLTLEEYLEFK